MKAIVTLDSVPPLRLGKKNLVVFPAGMSCRGKVLKAIRKHYRFW